MSSNQIIRDAIADLLEASITDDWEQDLLSRMPSDGHPEDLIADSINHAMALIRGMTPTPLSQLCIDLDQQLSSMRRQFWSIISAEGRQTAQEE